MREIELENEHVEENNGPTDVIEIELPKDKFAGTTNTRRSEAETIKKNFRAQKTLEDKLAFYIYLNAKIGLNNMNYDKRLNVNELYVPQSFNEQQKADLIADVKKNMEENIAWRKKMGLNVSAKFSPEEDQLIEDLKQEIVKEIVGDGSRKAFEEGLKKTSVIFKWLDIKGREAYDHYYSMLPEDEPQRDKKAQYLAYKSSGSEASMLKGAYNGMMQDLIGDFSMMADNNNFGLNDKIFDALNFNKEYKFSQFMRKMGLDQDEAKDFLRRNNANEEDNVYEVYKNNIIANREGEEGIEPTEEEIIAAIKTDYLDELIKGVVDHQQAENSTVLSEKITLDKNKTMGYYLGLQKLNAYEREAFLKSHQFKEIKEVDGKSVEEVRELKEDDKILDFFGQMIKADQRELARMKKIKMDSGQSPEKAEIITEQDVITYSKEFMKNLNNRYELKIYVDRDKMTVDQFANALGYNKQEREAFYQSKNCNKNELIKDVFKRDLTKNMSEEKRAQVKDDDIYNEADNYMKIELRRLKTLGRGKQEINNTNQVLNDFTDAFELEGERNHYLKGVNVGIGEGLMPKDNPKTDEQREYKNWVENYANKYLDDNYLKDTEKSLTKIKNIIGSGKQLNIRGVKEVSRYYDTKEPTTDCALLNAVIKELEATGTGGRKANTDKYETMLKCLKDYEHKVYRNEQNGMLKAKNDLIAACKNYVSGRESKRKAPYGNTRFYAASTLLSTLMPRAEFDAWASRVNTRGNRNEEDKINFDRMSERKEQYIATEHQAANDLQESTNGNYTELDPDGADMIVTIESIYGLRPDLTEELQAVFTQEMRQNKLKPMGENEKFVPIGPSYNNGSLSDKDFAAIALAGTMTTEVQKLDPRCHAQEELKALYTARDYSTELCKKPVHASCGRYLDCIDGGRNAAINAMNEYAAGNKFILAHVIASGIRFMAAHAREESKLNDNMQFYAEMGGRLTAMLERDPELKEMANNFENFEQDLDYMKSMAQVADIHRKAKRAMGKINRMINPPADYNLGEHQDQELWEQSREGKESFITDVILEKVINESITKYADKKEKARKYVDAYTIGLEELELSVKHFGNFFKDKILNEEQYQAKINDVNDSFHLRCLRAKDRNRQDTLVSGLTSDKTVATLREQVKEMVKSSGIGKKQPAEILEALKSKRIVGKIADLSQKAREASEKEAVTQRNLKRQAAHKARQNAPHA